MQTPVQTADDFLALVEAEEARRHLRDFIPLAWKIVEPATPYIHGWHVEAISDHLEAVTRGEIRNLLINMPPRMMKSLIVSVMWPMWVWLQRPEYRWLFASYAAPLAIRDSLKCRRIVESDWYQRYFGDIVQLAPDQNMKSRYENTARGYRLALSVGGGITGEGADAVVSDDPHNVKTAESALIRESTLEWWDLSISSRLNNPKTGSKVIVMQRVHADDLSAHVLATHDYEHLNLPMEYDPSSHCVTSIGWEDPRKQEGELLCPERVGPDEVASLKRSLGIYGYAGQYQQRPTPKAGGAFQRAWLSHRYRELPVMKSVVQSIDSAFKEGVANDFSVIATWGADDAYYYLIHVWRERVAFPELLAAIKDQHARFHPRAVLIEDKASGQSAIQMVRSTTRIPVIPMAADGTKESRADSVSPMFQSGKVLLPESAEWLDAWVDEHVHFPRSAHDDQVDTTSYGLMHLSQHSRGLDTLRERAALRDVRTKLPQDIPL